jgi:hypothetical protein
MNDEISHLTSSAAALLAETGDRRIRAIRSLLISIENWL